MSDPQQGWVPSRSQFGLTTLFVAEGAFVILIGLRQPVWLVAVTSVTIWLLMLAAVVIYNLVRKAMRP